MAEGNPWTVEDEREALLAHARELMAMAAAAIERAEALGMAADELGDLEASA